MAENIGRGVVGGARTTRRSFVDLLVHFHLLIIDSFLCIRHQNSLPIFYVITTCGTL